MKLHHTKILKILIVMMYIIVIIANFSIAAFDVTEQFSGQLDESKTDVTPVKTIVGTILDVVRMVGIGIALIILIYIGIKIMAAAPSEKAAIKQYSINYVIGAGILIGASGILTIIRDFTKNTVKPD